MRKFFSVLVLLIVLLGIFTSCTKDVNNNGATNETEATEEIKKRSSETETTTMTGTLYAVFGQDYINEYDFKFVTGACSPELIAGALSQLTGLEFSIKAEFDFDKKALNIQWLSDSSLVTGIPPEQQKDEFHFYDAESMRWFMLNSLCMSIRKNMGDYDVYYSIEDSSLNELELNYDFDEDTPYNDISDIRALG